MQMRSKLVVFAFLCATLRMPAQSTDTTSWKKLEFLFGKWTGVAGEKDTQLGAGQGAFSFDPELDQKIIVRHNNATYTSGVRHDDLLIIYLENDKPRAIYFDSEGHVIRYDVTVPSPNAVTFESDGTQPGPKYRLSYGMEKGSLNGKFEIAPPGAQYKTYMSWTSKKN
jgi:hypothetical protein